jgi:hypothetical protein
MPVPDNAWSGAAQGLMNVNQMFNERKRADQEDEKLAMEKQRMSMEIDKYNKEQQALDRPMTLSAIMGPKVSKDSEYYKKIEGVFKENKLMDDRGLTSIRNIKRYTDLVGYKDVILAARDGGLADIRGKIGDIDDQIESLSGKEGKEDEIAKLTKQKGALESKIGPMFEKTDKGLEAHAKWETEKMKRESAEKIAENRDATTITAAHIRANASKNKESAGDKKDNRNLAAFKADFPNATNETPLYRWAEKQGAKVNSAVLNNKMRADATNKWGKPTKIFETSTGTPLTQKQKQEKADKMFSWAKKEWGLSDPDTVKKLDEIYPTGK